MLSQRVFSSRHRVIWKNCFIFIYITNEIQTALFMFLLSSPCFLLSLSPKRADTAGSPAVAPRPRPTDKSFPTRLHTQLCPHWEKSIQQTWGRTANYMSTKRTDGQIFAPKTRHFKLMILLMSHGSQSHTKFTHLKLQVFVIHKHHPHFSCRVGSQSTCNVA